MESICFYPECLALCSGFLVSMLINPDVDINIAVVMEARLEWKWGRWRGEGADLRLASE